MNREIKFRAWDKEREKMDYAPVYVNPPNLDINSIFRGSTLLWMQYTGLKDENEKDIFEGDIFDCIYKFDGCKKHKLIVVWSKNTASFRLKDYGECHQPNVVKSMGDLERLKIIGNIYEDKNFKS